MALKAEFWVGKAYERFLLIDLFWQAACVNPTNVRRNDHSGSSSCNSSFRKSEKPKINVAKKKLSCAEQMALESPMASPQMTKKASENCQRKISAPANLENCQSNQQVKSHGLRDILPIDI